MRLSDFISKRLINLNLQAKGKKETLEELTDLLARQRIIPDREKMVNVLLERESLGSTGVGNGIAIPHTKTDLVKKITIVFGKSEKGIDFDSLDKNPVYLVFLIIAPEEAYETYLRVLARISRLLHEEKIRKGLRAAQSPRQVINLIRKEEKEAEE
ncbi:PTS sugar transporter subunit IIA [bacterium]|nr:PTS sugar transporter subunit IIA [bacterium]MBU4310796.1 PTS sugar transporter subunit IIA [bacterium]MBU4561386.1 PTS sugar transporter subunit IIA [bacterium]MCG2676827.1 PTS sugar transporter subunit IIA [bacterium]MCG2677389.1 PTS sugar transporter subunit IIA [bacterium]